MNILVPCKRCIDYNVAIHVKEDKTSVVKEGVKMSMNPFDEIALEEALRLKEKGLCKTITALTIDTVNGDETLRHALAMGADYAKRIDQPPPDEPWVVAKLLQQAMKDISPDLVLMGKLAIDGDHSQVGPLLAGFLNWPQATFISNLTINNAKATATREVDEGLETIEISLPAVITTDLRLNKPRYIALPNLIKARQKPIDLLTYPQNNQEPRTRLIQVSKPTSRTPGTVYTDLSKFIHDLQKKGIL
ncbi:MAG TPA: electron transfer flavoprotein subunit beta/FixA family protein [Gammaproteobacteria bacterium]|nr:electron transfer flavoprotein subunit beta/FixA family protein [Gammaproteobacteria bacterium]